jgi:hypothetical protein
MKDLRLTYDEFFQFIWDDSNLSRIVSVSYQSKYEDYIRSFTFDMFNLYEKANLPERVVLKIFELHFFNLFRFQPSNENIKEIEDSYKDY